LQQGKEELQSDNEELETTNDELQQRTDDPNDAAHDVWGLQSHEVQGERVPLGSSGDDVRAAIVMMEASDG